MKHPKDIFNETEEQLRKSLENPAMDILEREIRTNALMLKKLDSIEKPHWSTTPMFWVSLVAMVAACIAAYPVLFPSQAQQSDSANHKVQNEPSNSQMPLQQSQPSQ